MDNASFLAQVPTGMHHSIGELRGAFDVIAPAANWKMPIARVLCVPVEFQPMVIGLMKEAVDFMAGGRANVYADGDLILVQAPGYYALIGA